MSPAKETDLGSDQIRPTIPLSGDEGCELASMFRLPQSILPVNYNIAAGFDIPGRKFVARAVVKLSVRKETSIICLNAKLIKFLSVELRNVVTGDTWDHVKLDTNTESEVARFEFGKVLTVGADWELVMLYEGEIRAGLQGVYVNKYMDDFNEEKEGVATLFAATEARSFLPCWDQPDMKASFELSCFVPEHLDVISNMAGGKIIASEPPDWLKHLTCASETTWAVFDFPATPKMSTYLLCFVIGKYGCVSKKVGDTTLSVHCPPRRTYEAHYALDIAVKCLDIFREFFGIAYCLPKLDLVAVSCISVGAMENWGVVTFRENSLLVDQATAATPTLQGVASIVAHEVSHQWFGNLVTMDWWSDLWLNEGFATYMQYFAVHKIHPEFKMWEQFCGDVVITALQLDALENSHPVKVKVENPRHIDEVFDKISYRKGASIIRMLESVMGEESFKGGIRRYMKEFSYSNACTQDLWRCLGKVEDTSVEELMDCWVSHMGFPLVKVSLMKEPDRKYLYIEQERYSASHKFNDRLLWRIPISIRVRLNEEAKELLDLPGFILKDRSAEITLPAEFDVDKGGFVKINPDSRSYFRTFYSGKLEEALEVGIREKILPTVDRLTSLEDRVSLVLAEQGNTVTLIKLCAKLKAEDSFLVWKNTAAFFIVLKCIVWSNDFLADKFDRFVISVMEPCLDRIGWNITQTEDHNVAMLRALLVAQLGTRGCQSVREKCSEIFSSFISGKSIMVPGFMDVVLKVVLSGCDDHQAYETILPLMENPKDRNCVLQSLGFANNKDVLTKVLNLSLDPKLRDQEAVMVLASVCQNRLGVRLAWDFYKNNIDHFYERYGNGLFLMAKLIKCVTENFNTIEDYNEVSDFFYNHSYIGCERTVKQAKENIALNMEWKQRALDSVTDFFKSLEGIN